MGTKEQNMIIGAGEIAPLNESDQKCVVKIMGAQKGDYSPYSSTTIENDFTEPESTGKRNFSKQVSPFLIFYFVSRGDVC